MPTRTHALGLLALLVALVLPASAEDDAFTSRKAKAARADLDKAMTAAQKAHRTALLTAQRAYLRSMKDAQKEVMRAGDLEEARRVSEVVTWLEGSVKELEAGATPQRVDDRRPLVAAPAVAAQRGYMAAVGTAVAAHRKAKAAALGAYEADLKAALQPILQAAKDLAEAERIQAAIRRVGAQLRALEAAEGWVVLFRSRDPADWDTFQDQGDRVAIPLADAPRDVRWLRLTRLDTHASVVVAITADRLGADSRGDVRFGWSGAKTRNEGGLHLGIDDLEMKLGVRDGGRIMVNNARSTSGWGFGHKVHVNDAQYWAWAGKEIPACAFEVAVTARDLTDEEHRLRLDGDAKAPAPGGGGDDDDDAY